jgi:hypothetical protein
MIMMPTIGTGWLLSLSTPRFIGSTPPSLTVACTPVITGNETERCKACQFGMNITNFIP